MRKLICALSTGASIISLMAMPGIPLWAHILLGLLGVISFGYLVWDDIYNSKRNEKVYYNDAEVREAMKGIIKCQGKICIMSRALSWVDDDVIRIMTKKKNSILIFAQEPNDITNKLKENGIQVRFYGSYGFVPKTRFTVIRYDRNNPQVAIANGEHNIKKQNGYKHVIYETLPGKENKHDAWINSLAADMISLCDLTTRRTE